MNTCANTSQIFQDSGDDATPVVFNGRIRDGYDELPSKFTPSTLQENEEEDQFILPLVWKNKLYISRVKRNTDFKKLHTETFPRLNDEQMAFVYYHFFSNPPRKAIMDTWNTPKDIKDYVTQRLGQLYMADH